jgi:hypothetical protein
MGWFGGIYRFLGAGAGFAALLHGDYFLGLPKYLYGVTEKFRYT